MGTWIDLAGCVRTSLADCVLCFRWSWRTKIVDLLTTPINKKEDATKEAGDGDTDIYAQGQSFFLMICLYSALTGCFAADLIGQTELEAYFQAYSAAIAE